MAALKLSYNSNISVILVLAFFDCFYSVLYIPGSWYDEWFFIATRHSGMMGCASYLNLLFKLAFSETTPSGEEVVLLFYCQERLDVQVPFLIPVDTWGVGKGSHYCWIGLGVTALY